MKNTNCQAKLRDQTLDQTNKQTEVFFFHMDGPKNPLFVYLFDIEFGLLIWLDNGHIQSCFYQVNLGPQGVLKS